MGHLGIFLQVASWPTAGLWEGVIGWLYNLIGNIGWTIVLFTVLLKIVLFPLDFFQKKSMRKTTDMMSKLQPQIQALETKYGNNKDMLNQKKSELFQKEGFNAWSGCSSMLLPLVTMIIFITMFTALVNVSHVRIQYEYDQLFNEYQVTYDESIDLGNGAEVAAADAQEAVVTTYGEIKEGWAWIQNIWRPDTWASVFPSFDEYVSSSSVKFNSYTAENPYTDLYGVQYTDEATAKVAFQADYETVTAGIQTTYTGWNGWLLLIILTGALSFLSIYFTNLGSKSKNKKGEEVKTNPQTNKMMMILFPILIVVITIWYSSAFALYMAVNSALSILSNYLTNVIINKINNRTDEQSVKVVEYARKK